MKGEIKVNDREIKSLIDSYLLAYNSFNVDGMIELLHEDIEFRNISNDIVNTETKGIDQFRALAEQSLKFFSTRCQTARSIKISGDKAEVDIDYEAKLAADLPNGLKAGEMIKLKGKSIFRFKNGKIVVIEDHS